jgi:hypothetical protein
MAGEGVGLDSYGRAGDLDLADASEDLCEHELEAPQLLRLPTSRLRPLRQRHVGAHILDDLKIPCPTTACPADVDLPEPEVADGDPCP